MKRHKLNISPLEYKAAPEGKALHRAAKGLSRTIARLVKRETEQPSLFNNALEDIGEEVQRNAISRNAAILCDILIQEIPPEEDTLIITNLAYLAKKMNVQNFELKRYLLALGGFVYPIISYSAEDGATQITIEQIFKITFTLKNTAQQYAGTNLLRLAENAEFTKIEVKLNRQFVRERTIHEPKLLKKNKRNTNGFGYVYRVNDEYQELAQTLSDVAYKLLSYTSTQKAAYKIGYSKLLAHLDLDAQVRKQGRPRIHGQIMKGLEELKQAGHLNEYEYDPDKEQYAWNCSRNFVQFTTSTKADGEV